MKSKCLLKTCAVLEDMKNPKRALGIPHVIAKFLRNLSRNFHIHQKLACLWETLGFQFQKTWVMSGFRYCFQDLPIKTGTLSQHLNTRNIKLLPVIEIGISYSSVLDFVSRNSFFCKILDKKSLKITNNYSNLFVIFFQMQPLLFHQFYHVGMKIMLV